LSSMNGAAEEVAFNQLVDQAKAQCFFRAD
jgi:hypothetical protein